MAAIFDGQQAEHFRVHVSGYRFSHPPASSVPANVPLETIKHSVQNCIPSISVDRHYPWISTAYVSCSHEKRKWGVATKSHSYTISHSCCSISLLPREFYVVHVRVGFFNVHVAVPKKQNRHVGKKDWSKSNGSMSIDVPSQTHVRLLETVVLPPSLILTASNTLKRFTCQNPFFHPWDLKTNIKPRTSKGSVFFPQSG